MSVGHSTRPGIEDEREFSHYYVSLFIHTSASTFALPTFAFYNWLFSHFAFYTCPFKNPRSAIGLLIIDSSCTLLSFSRRLAIFTRLTLYLGTRMFDSHFNSQNTHSHFRNSYFTLALLALNALKHFLRRPNRNVFSQFRLPHYTHIRSHTPVFYQHPKPTPLPLIESA